MSQAFMRERDEPWLHEVAPTINALIVYITREQNGIQAYLKKSYFSKKENRDVYEMSDGLTYAIDDNSKWYIPD